MLVFAGVIFWTDRYEKEPVRLIGGVFLWGAIFAAGAAFLINSLAGAGIYLVTLSEAASNLATGALIAPLVEETLKGLAVLFVFLALRREFDSILDGIVYAAIVALGFAATENAYYIFKQGYLENGYAGLLWLVFVRVVLVGWQHPFYTAFIGIGLAISRLSRKALVWVVAPIAGWMVAIYLHAAHNALASVLSGIEGLAFATFYDWGGWFFMVLFVLWAIYREKLWISQHLQEEVRLGLITPAQYHVACSAWAQGWTRISALFKGRYQVTSRFYQTCAELAHKKQQLLAVGEETNNSGLIEALRADLRSLSPKAHT